MSDKNNVVVSFRSQDTIDKAKNQEKIAGIVDYALGEDTANGEEAIKNMDNETALAVISEIGNRAAAKSGWAITNIFSNNPELLQEGEVRGRAIETLKTINRGAARWITSMATIHNPYRAADAFTGVPPIKTHEDEYIAALQEIGGPDAVKGLAAIARNEYPEKAIEALKTMDVKTVPSELLSAGHMDFGTGLQQHNVDALNALAEIHDAVLSGKLKQILVKDVETFTGRMLKTLLDAPKLLEALRKLDNAEVSPSQAATSIEVKRSEDNSGARKLVAAFQSALENIDSQNIIPDTKVAPIFAAVVDLYEKTKTTESTLQKLITTLGLDKYDANPDLGL